MSELQTGTNGGNGQAVDPLPEGGVSPELRALSILADRYQWAQQHGLSFGGKRDLYQVLGYARDLTVQDYRDTYARGGIAKRIVEVLPNATWRGSMELIEDEKRSTYTEFEQAWVDLDRRLQIQAKLRRVDILAGLSTYAVLLIGAPGDLETELPKATKPEDLLYLTPFLGGGGPSNGLRRRQSSMGADATIFEFDLDAQSPRFGLPISYQLCRTEISSFTRPVHWSRVIHVAEGCLDDDVFGIPVLENVMNLLDDLAKCTGGGSEAFWLRANAGMALNISKDFAPAAAKEVRAEMLAKLEEQSEKYRDQMQRWIRTYGVDVKQLGSDVANFTGPVDAILKQIAGARGTPLRILTGSEMGELASSQDRENFADVVNGRQTGYAGPSIVRNLADRLITYNYLPTPRQYDVVWPHLQTMTEAEKVEGAKGWAAVNATNPVMVFTEPEIRAKWADREPLTDAQKREALDDQQAAAEAAAPPALAAAPEEPAFPRAARSAAPLEYRAAQLGADYDLGSTQVQLPPAIADRLFSFLVDEDDLAEKGREDDAHVTVKYGLHTNDVIDVERVLDGAKPITLTLGQTNIFTADDYDVLYVEVRSQDLVQLNKVISSSLDVTDTHPVYQPHATIAYLKPGTGHKYVGDARFDGLTATVSEVLFISAEDEKTLIPLAKQLDDELLQVLAAAIESNNTDVIDALIGVSR